MPQPGTQGGRSTAFQGPRRRLNGTRLARWDEEAADPWLLLTDLAPRAGDAGWDGLRAWSEHGFTITKRGGWQWPRTRMSEPQRAARLWVTVAVATWWLLSVGGLAEETIPGGTLLALPATGKAQSRARLATQLRCIRVFRQGWVSLLVALLTHHRLPLGRFVPEPWPSSPLENPPRLIDMLPLAA